jgi:hypothetical protein
MRKFIYIISTILILLFGVLLGTPYLLSVFDLDQKLKDYVTNRLSEDGETIINVNDIAIKFGKIELREIEYKSESARANFMIRGIEFDYNFFTLLTNIKEPHRAIDKIYLVEPRVIFKDLNQQELLTSSKADTTKINLLEILNQFENIDRIHLKNGSLSLERKGEENLALAKSLNGWIDCRDFTSISINADGDIFYGSDANFEMFGQVNLEEESFYIQLDLHDYDFRSAPIAKINEYLQIKDGIIDSKLDIKSVSFNLDSITINGYVDISQTTFRLFESDLTDLEMHAQIDNNKLILNDGRGKIENSIFTIAANINDIFDPEIIGEIRSDRLEITTIADYFKLKGFERNNISLNGRFKISQKKLAATAGLSAPQIKFNEQQISKLRADVILDDDMLKFSKLNFNVLGFEVNGISTTDLTSGVFNTHFISNRNFDEHYFFDNLSSAAELIHIDINGNFSEEKAEGKWDYLLSNPMDTLLTITGKLGLEKDVFTFSNDRTDINDFLLTLQISDVFDSPTINFGYLENLPFHILTSRKWVADLVRNYEVEGILAGTIGDLNAQVSIVDRANPKRQFAITSNIHDLIKVEKRINGSIKFNKFLGEYNLSLGNDFLTGSIQSNHTMRGSIDLNLSREEQIRCILNLNNFALNKLLIDTTLSGYGELNGDVNITGTLDDPRMNAALIGDRFVINDMGYYSFDLALEADTNRLKLDNLKIALNNRAILNGSLEIDYESESVLAVVHGDDVDADYIIQTLFHESDLVSGTGRYRFEVRGSLESPRISGEINLSDGTIQKIPYDEITIGLQDSLAEGKPFLDYKNHHINVKEFVALKAGQYHLEGSGNLPLFEDGTIDLHVKYDGDLLWLIPKWDDFFIDGASFTTIRIGVAGTPNRPRITEGTAIIERGELWLDDVARHIENIQGKIYIEENSNYIVLENISAEIDGQKLMINNEKSVTTHDGKVLEPWYFKNLNLNFGILAMETSRGGIELTIPSLMVEGESGILALSGKTPAEKFYFAGPVKAPQAWGNVQLSDARITYPFYPAERAEPSNAVKFLRSINWDLEVNAGKDLYYMRDIPSLLGEVKTELNIDPSSEGLLFVGIIDENTFEPEGKLTSSRGRIEYLDLNFRVENFGFIVHRGESEPEVYGRAWTSVRDSIGAIPKTIYLELYAVDEASNAEIRRARWEDFRFRLVSADPTVGESQEQVLAYLGYSVQNMQDKAKQVGGAVTDNYLIRPLLRPIERGLEKYLGFDFVRFNAKIAQNLFSVGSQTQSQTGLYAQNYRSAFIPYAFLIQSSEFTLGKYLTQNLYFTYTGQVVASAYENQSEFNLNHSLGLEYRFFKNLLFEFEYDRETLQIYHIYSDKSYQEDFKVRFRYSFSF